MLAITSDARITPAATKTSTPRAGNGVPSASVNGSDSAAASVIAPRTPASVLMAITRVLRRGAGSPRQRACNRMAQSMSHIQIYRVASSTRVMAITNQPRCHSSPPAMSATLAVARATMCGICRPSSTNTMPLNTNSSIDQRLLACMRVVSSPLRVFSPLSVMPAATAERMPDTPSASASR